MVIKRQKFIQSKNKEWYIHVEKDRLIILIHFWAHHFFTLDCNLAQFYSIYDITNYIYILAIVITYVNYRICYITRHIQFKFSQVSLNILNSFTPHPQTLIISFMQSVNHSEWARLSSSSYCFVSIPRLLRSALSSLFSS